MRAALTALFAGLATAVAAADLTIVEPMNDNPLAAYQWEARPVVVFADSPRDPRFVQQMQELEERGAELAERDVVVIVDTAPGPSRFETTPLREELRPRDFTMILIGKDGGVKLRRPNVISGRELIRAIDRMPMRQQEIGR